MLSLCVSVPSSLCFLDVYGMRRWVFITQVRPRINMHWFSFWGQKVKAEGHSVSVLGFVCAIYGICIDEFSPYLLLVDPGT